LRVIFTLLDPDPESGSGYGSYGLTESGSEPETLAEMTYRSKWGEKYSLAGTAQCSPKNASDLFADVDGGLRIVDEVVHLAVVLALVTLDPQPPAHRRRRLLRLHKTRRVYSVLRIRDQGSGAFLTPGSGIRDG
jgi:hypothetical protein